MPRLYGSSGIVPFHPPVSNNLASRRPLSAFGAAVTRLPLYLCMLYGSTALCIQIPYSHTPKYAIQWRSQTHPIVPHSCVFAGSPRSYGVESFQHGSGFFWLRAPLPENINREKNDRKINKNIYILCVLKPKCYFAFLNREIALMMHQIEFMATNG